MNIKSCLLSALLLVPAVVPAVASADPQAAPRTADTQKASTKLEGDDLKLASHVKHVNDMEIDMGKLAQKNGTATVKKYGATLVKDHTASNTKLAALAKKKGVAKVPNEVPASDVEKAEHQAMMDGMAKLKALKGAEFDQQFLTMMVADHEKTVARLDAGISSAKDAELVAFLKETKPVVQGHADAARDLQTKAGTSTR